MNRSSLLVLCAAIPVWSAALPAQQGRVVLPPGYDTTEAPGSTAYGWGQGVNQRRVQWIYDSSYFTSQGIDHPISITRLRWRANGASVVRGGSYAQASVMLASATADCRTPSATFAANLASDATLVHSGAVSVATGAGLTPNNWFVDLQLQTPFYYDPTQGADIVTDITVPPGVLTGTTPIHDAVFGGILGGRVVASTATASTGTTSSGGLIILEFGYDYPPGVAHGIPSGTGCGAGEPASFYELFDIGNPTDLGNTPGLTMLWTGAGYVVTPGASPIVAPTGAFNLQLADDATVQVTLPWGFGYAGGSTSSLWVCSNGWIALESTALTDPVESVARLLAGEPRVAAFWDDLDPTVSGGVHAETDPANGSVFHVTWDRVPEYGTAGAGNTFQVSFQQGGAIELKWGSLSTLDALVGYSPGNGAVDPGATDISRLAGALLLGDDRPALALVPGARPVIGRTGAVVVQNIPPAATVGLHLIGLASLPAPGVALDVLGAPGCLLQVAQLAAPGYGIGGSSATFQLAIPNDPSLDGASLFFQDANAVPGLNPLGLITSNLVEWRIHLR
ncbi:MAG: hypothetical protein IPM29_25140 [Planctomycetes bacterium]|nr:hypothetical protein [Planctomycetota bacterium]